MKKYIFLFFFILVTVLCNPAHGASLDPIDLRGLHVTWSEGPEVFLQRTKDGSQSSNVQWSHIIMEPSTFQISGEVTSPSRLYPGTPSVTLRVRSGSVRKTKILKLQWHGLLIFATRNIDRGETLSTSDMDVRLARYKRSYGEVYSDMSQLCGYRAARRIRSGDAISERDVERPMLVERGDPVIILSRSGTVEAKLEGVALESGGRGSTIRARVPRYRKDVNVKVLEAGVVLLETLNM